MNRRKDDVPEMSAEQQRNGAGARRAETESSVASDAEVVRFRRMQDVGSTRTRADGSPVEAWQFVWVQEKITALVETCTRIRQVLHQSTSVQRLSEPEKRVTAAQLVERCLQVRSVSDRPNAGVRRALAPFQVDAVRWMVEMAMQGLHVLLNDQVGMGQAAAVVAYLSVLDRWQEEAMATKCSEATQPWKGPHLLILPDDDVHEWAYHVREWDPNRRIQVYDGSTSQRKRLQREWKKRKMTSFLVDGDEDDEANQEIYCCICPLRCFLAEKEAFATGMSWRSLVVHAEGEASFEDVACVESLQQIHAPHKVLCRTEPMESWASSRLRTAWSSFLLDRLIDEASKASMVPAAELVELDETSVEPFLKACGKARAVNSSPFWKAQRDHVHAMLVALTALSLRRVRSDVEAQLGKVEEHSVSCTLSTSQTTQYQNAVSGFAASVKDREERLEAWLHLFLQLRSICNCVDVLHDLEKLGHADATMLESCSGKLSALQSLLQRIVTKESKRVAIYCQQEAMLLVLEAWLSLLNYSYVRVTGPRTTQLRALRHFSLRLAVSVILVPTRVSDSHRTHAMPVYGCESVVVLDSDWNALCDAKLRASWAKMAVSQELAVYRFHCESTIEESFLRVGSCLSERLFMEMTPYDVLAVSRDNDLRSVPPLGKPTWWTSQISGSFSALVSETSVEVEQRQRYTAHDLEVALDVKEAELDAEEHLLLANTDELTPVEWYAVHYVHRTTDRKRQEQESPTRASTTTGDISSAEWQHESTLEDLHVFDEVALAESKQRWQEAETQELFYMDDLVASHRALANDSKSADARATILLDKLRGSGMEVVYSVWRPPEPPRAPEFMRCDPGMDEDHQPLYNIAYRFPAPPPPPPAPKLKADGMATSQDVIKPIKLKKPRQGANNATSSGSAASTASMKSSTTAGVKRKHDQTQGQSKQSTTPALDLDGVPLPDVAEFESDDFWGDTNLDALDSGSWDDASVLSGILGPSLESSSSGPSQGGNTTSNATATGSSSTHASKSSTKKLKSGSGSGRSRKSSVSDNSKDGWTANDDLILKSLVDLYGPTNWVLIAQVVNAVTAISRFLYRKRSARQCADRYHRLATIGSSSSSSHKDSTKAASNSTKSNKNNASTVVWTAEQVTKRVSLPPEEHILEFREPLQSFPGLPPPPIGSGLTLVDLHAQEKQQAGDKQGSSTSSTSGSQAASHPDSTRSIRNSFGAIIQCMKHKTAPPPIPIPGASSSSSLASAAEPKASSGSNGVPSTPVNGVETTTVCTPHKSHADAVALLPSHALTPDEVIRRSKEAAAAAVQAAAAVASVGRDVSPLSVTGDVILGHAFGSSMATPRTPSPIALGGTKASPGAGTSVNANPRVHAVASSLTSPTVNTSGIPASCPGAGPAPLQATSTPGGARQTAHAPPIAWGAAGENRVLNPTLARSTSGSSPASNAMAMGMGSISMDMARGNHAASLASPMPAVSTSALLSMLDRMPEIKNKIQAILNRTDCSEAQKVALIARLLSSSNAMNATSVVHAAAAASVTTTPTAMTAGAASQGLVGVSSAAALTGGGPGGAQSSMASAHVPVVGPVVASSSVSSAAAMSAASVVTSTSGVDVQNVASSAGSASRGVGTPSSARVDSSSAPENTDVGSSNDS